MRRILSKRKQRIYNEAQKEKKKTLNSPSSSRLNERCCDDASPSAKATYISGSVPLIQRLRGDGGTQLIQPSGDNKLLNCRSGAEILSLPNSEDTLNFNGTERQNATSWASAAAAKLLEAVK